MHRAFPPGYTQPPEGPPHAAKLTPALRPLPASGRGLAPGFPTRIHPAARRPTTPRSRHRPHGAPERACFIAPITAPLRKPSRHPDTPQGCARSKMSPAPAPRGGRGCPLDAPGGPGGGPPVRRLDACGFARCALPAFTSLLRPLATVRGRARTTNPSKMQGSSTAAPLRGPGAGSGRAPRRPRDPLPLHFSRVCGYLSGGAWRRGGGRAAHLARTPAPAPRHTAPLARLSLRPLVACAGGFAA